MSPRLFAVGILLSFFQTIVCFGFQLTQSKVSYQSSFYMSSIIFFFFLVIFLHQRVSAPVAHFLDQLSLYCLQVPASNLIIFCVTVPCNALRPFKLGLPVFVENDFVFIVVWVIFQNEFAAFLWIEPKLLCYERRDPDIEGPCVVKVICFNVHCILQISMGSYYKPFDASFIHNKTMVTRRWTINV